MKILAIDPGSKQSALVVWDGEIVQLAKIMPNEDTLATLYAMRHREVRPDFIAIEQIRGFGMTAGNELFDSVWWTGRYFECAMAGGIDVRMIPRKTVVTQICETSKANDSAVRAALIYRFGGPGTRKEKGVTHGLVKDLWAAFAVAVYAHDTLRVEQCKVSHRADERVTVEVA